MFGTGKEGCQTTHTPHTVIVSEGEWCVRVGGKPRSNMFNGGGGGGRVVAGGGRSRGWGALRGGGDRRGKCAAVAGRGRRMRRRGGSLVAREQGDRNGTSSWAMIRHGFPKDTTFSQSLSHTHTHTQQG
ncbi:unnamed protein product [Boreogadus saida]